MGSLGFLLDGAQANRHPLRTAVICRGLFASGTCLKGPSITCHIFKKGNIMTRIIRCARPAGLLLAIHLLLPSPARAEFRSFDGTTEFVNFTIPIGDDIFVSGQTIELHRSLFNPSTGTSLSNPRQQTNFTTAFIDGSVIYGTDATTASILRGGPANPGAKLRTSNDINGDAENLLPRDAFGPDPTAPFVAGDDRVNDNVPLTA